MNKTYAIIAGLLILILIGCTTNDRNSKESDQVNGISETIIDSLLHFRRHSIETDLLPRRLPELTKNQAIEIQLAMLKKEMESGAKQIGWKMGGTVSEDSTNYDPMFGYMLDTHLIKEDSTLLASNFPGGRVMVEGEIGFVINKDFKNGVDSIEKLKEGIAYVTNAVEFAQDISIPINNFPNSKNINHTIASGMGHAGVILGSGKMKVEDFDADSETVKCFINNKLVSEGTSNRIYRGPIYALYSLANLLPKYGAYLKKGDVVVTGSAYDNPTISSTSDVRLEFSSLGVIGFHMK